LNRQTIVQFPLVTGEPGRKTIVTDYDELGRRVGVTDQASIVARFGYDDAGRLVAVTNDWHQPPAANPFVTLYKYDEAGNLVEQTDANSHTTRFEFNKLGQRIRRRLPGDAGTVFEELSYDGAGNVSQRKDFAGKVTAMTYDAWNRLRTQTPDPSLSEPNVSFTYYAHGGRHTMNDASGQTTYVYDELNRLTEKQTPYGRLVYTYGGLGKVATMRTDNTSGSAYGRATVSYTWDSRGRLAAVSDSAHASKPVVYSYDAVGNLKSFLLPNGVEIAHTFDEVNRLRELQMTKAGVASPLARYIYTVGASVLRGHISTSNKTA
jgi:YD repeat-containing protein